MDIATLAQHLNVDKIELFTKISGLIATHKLNIPDFNDITPHHYNFIRATLDPTYLMQLTGVIKPDRKYKYHKSPNFTIVVDFISNTDFNGCSTKEIQSRLPYQTGHQVVGAAMRANGYDIKVVYLDKNKQGRRWFSQDAVAYMNGSAEDMSQWVATVDLSGYTATEINTVSPVKVNRNELYRIMKLNGYRIKRTATSRRWFKEEVSFL